MKRLPLCKVSTLPDSGEGRPRFLAHTPLGAVVVLFVGDALAYVRTPDSSDAADVPEDVRRAGLTVNGTPYAYASGHFRKGPEGWAVDLDGFRPRLTLSRGHATGGLLGDSTESARSKACAAFAQACDTAAQCGPEVLPRAARAEARQGLDRLDRKLAEHVEAFGKAQGERERLARDLALASGDVPPEPLPRLEVEQGRPVLALDGAEVTLALGVSGLRLAVDFDPDGDREAFDALRVGEHVATPADDVSALLFDTGDAGRRELGPVLDALLGLLGEREGLRLAQGRAPGEVLAVDRRFREAFAVADRAAGVLGRDVPAEVEVAVARLADVVRAARAVVVAGDDLLANWGPGEAWNAWGHEVERLARHARSAGPAGRRSRRLLDLAAEVAARPLLDTLREHVVEAVARLAEAVEPFGEAVES